MSKSRDENNRGGGANDIWIGSDVTVNKDSGRSKLRRLREFNKDGGWPNFKTFDM